MNRISLPVFACLLLASPAFAPPAKPDPAGVEFFEKKVRPLLAQHCYECHASQATKVKGGLRLDTAAAALAGGSSGAVIVPGHPEKSLLIEAVRWKDEDTQMPPKKKLADGEIAIFEQWVKMGAPYPGAGSDAAGDRGVKPTAVNIEEGRRFWAFQPVAKPAVPQVKNAAWAKGDIDRFILAGLEANGLKPAADADKMTLLRRVTFDLTGLPPTPAEIDAFLGDASPRAFEKVVDRLLASKQFGERWGRHWLDIVRYAESTGMSRNYPYPYAWRYRDYVIDAFNSDKPYDLFIAEQVAGDLLPVVSLGDRDAQRIATGFLALGAKDLNERNAVQYQADNIDEQIDVMSRSVLALSVSCARCHDHKFDPIPQTDYYALAGIFKSTETLAGYSNRQGGGNKQAGNLLLSLSGATGPSADPKVVAAAGKADAEAKTVAKIESQLEAARQQLKKLQAKKKEDAKAKKADAVQARIKEVQGEIRELEQRLKSAGQDVAPAGGAAMAMGVRDGKPSAATLYLKGDVDKPAQQVERGLIQVLDPAGAKPIAMPANSSGRRELAQWLASPKNPLTSRVMVNRVWHHLFGQGIVRTVDNFGVTGDRPSHPQLLDHLASRFAADGWSVKNLIRQIVLSRSYQMSSAIDAGNFNKDSDNRFVWRQNQRRLQVEAIRDAMLLAAGRLDLTPALGSPVEKLAIGEINGKNGSLFSADSAASFKRAIYTPIIRSGLPGMYELFDFPEPSLVSGAREITTVPTQALFMMNSPFVIEQSKAMAARLLAEKNMDDATRVDRLYRAALGRSPHSAELQRAVKFVSEYGKDAAAGWPALCQALFACAEFRYVN